MEAAQLGPNPYAEESRIARSWRLQLAAWRLIRHNPAMLGLSLIGIFCSVTAAVLVFALASRISGLDSRLSVALVGAVAAYPSVFVSIFVNVALAYAASAAFDGERVSLREAIDVAESRLGAIMQWSLITVVVGFLLNQVAQRIPGGGRVAGWLLGAAWAVGTLFVVPILALERAPAVPALRRSAAIAKRRWAEEVGGNIAIGAWTVVIALPAVLLMTIGGAAVPANHAAGATMVFIGLIAMLTALALAATARQVFAVALYRHAIDAPAGGFSTWDLENPFTGTPERKRRKSWILRIGGGFLALFFVIALIAAIAHRDRHTAADGYFHLDYAARYAPSFHAGMPVVYRHRQIGEVVSVEVEGPTATVSFQVLQGYQGIVPSSEAFVHHAHGRAYLLLRPGAPGSPGGPGQS